MENTSPLLRRLLEHPVTDHLLFRQTEVDNRSIRFSNNEINRENSRGRMESLSVTVGGDRKIGSGSTNDLTEAGIRAALERAHTTAKLLPEDPEYMPALTREEVATVPRTGPRLVEIPEIPEERQVAFLSDLFRRMKKHFLTCAGLLATDRVGMGILNNRGVELWHEDQTFSLKITAMTANSSFKGTFTGRRWEELDSEKFLAGLEEKAALSRDPKPIEAGKYTVVLSPEAAIELTLMFLAYNFDAKAVDEKRTALSDRRDQEIAAKKIRIFSQPGYDRAPGLPFSLEDGMPFRAFDMIKDGRLGSPWYSRFWAKKQGKEPTGRFPSNIIFAGTDRSDEDLIRGVEDGLYVNSFWYIRLVDLMDGIFTGMTRDGVFRIKNGRVGESVRNLRFNQNVFEMLKNTVDIGREKRFRDDWMGLDFSFPTLTVRDFNFTSTTEF